MYRRNAIQSCHSSTIATLPNLLARFGEIVNIRLVNFMVVLGVVKVAVFYFMGDIWSWGGQYILSRRTAFPRKMCFSRPQATEIGGRGAMASLKFKASPYECNFYNRKSLQFIKVAPLLSVAPSTSAPGTFS